MKKKSPINPSNVFVIKPHLNIGEPGAEDDSNFLNNCFVDNGDVEILADTNSPKSIVVGRTGIGKTALLSEFSNRFENVIKIEPHELSLNFVSNSTIIRYFETLEVNLDLFYQLLWKHVLVVTLLKSRYKIISESSNKSFFSKLSRVLEIDKTKKLAVEYLQQWSSDFWLETEAHVKEVTKKIEDKLNASAEIGNGVGKLKSGSNTSFSEIEKAEFKTRAQKVVNELQLKSLSRVFDLLDQDVFEDDQKPYYILIDKLDENWTNNEIRFKLIRALIETVKHFRKVRNVKIIVALRQDLLEKVVHSTKDYGFQEEKYETSYLRIRWNKLQLRNLLETRVKFLLRRQYSGRDVSINEITPKQIRDTSFIDYVLERTLWRPRDVIAFMNAYLFRMSGQSKPSIHKVFEAEADYSKKRLIAMYDEWKVDFPNLQNYFEILIGRKPSFQLREISVEIAQEFAFNLAEFIPKDPLKYAAEEFIGEHNNAVTFLSQWAATLYKIGVLGLKLEPNQPTQWSYSSEADIDTRRISDETKITVNKMFRSAFGSIEDKQR